MKWFWLIAGMMNGFVAGYNAGGVLFQHQPPWLLLVALLNLAVGIFCIVQFTHED